MKPDFDPNIHLELYMKVKEMIKGIDYSNQGLDSSYRKLRHHLNRLIEQLEKSF